MDADVDVVHPLAVTLYVIVADPADTPVTTPLALTSATVALLVDQIPPVVELAKTVVEPTQTLDAPVIAATTGNGFIVALNVNVFPTHVPLVGVTV